MIQIPESEWSTIDCSVKHPIQKLNSSKCCISQHSLVFWNDFSPFLFSCELNCQIIEPTVHDQSKNTKENKFFVVYKQSYGSSWMTAVGIRLWGFFTATSFSWFFKRGLLLLKLLILPACLLLLSPHTAELLFVKDRRHLCGWDKWSATQTLSSTCVPAGKRTHRSTYRQSFLTVE